MNVRLVAITKPTIGDGKMTASDFITFAARVSNPSNQMSLLTAPKLLAYCIKHGHWSIFEQASMTVEIQTSRAISAQILRHRSFCFQEFSQRYAPSDVAEPVELRTQDRANRQGAEMSIRKSGPLKLSPSRSIWRSEPIALCFRRV